VQCRACATIRCPACKPAPTATRPAPNCVDDEDQRSPSESDDEAEFCALADPGTEGDTDSSESDAAAGELLGDDCDLGQASLFRCPQRLLIQSATPPLIRKGEGRLGAVMQSRRTGNK